MTSAATDYEPPQLTHREILLVFSALLLGMLLAAMDQTVLATALPTIVGELSGLEHLSWVITSYLLTTTASVPLYGKIGDMYGRKAPFQVAILIFLVGSLLAGMAQDMTQLIICRGIQGIGAGGIMSLAQAIIADIVSPRERGRYVGYFVLVFAGSSIIGPLMGGVFVDQLSWRWVFFINIPLGAIAFAVAARVLRLPKRRTPHRLDLVGAALVMASASCILLAMSWGGNQYAWGSVTIVGLLASGIGLAALFVFNELKVAEPLLPMGLFKQRIFSVSSVLGLITGMAMFGTIAFLPLYLQIVKGIDPTASGLRTLPLIFAVLFGSIFSGRMITKTGKYRIFPIVGTACLTVSLFLLSRFDADTDWWQISASMALTGLGMGLVMQVITLAVQNSVEYRDMGVGTAAVNFARSMGGALGVAIFGAILSNRLNVYLPRFVPAGGDTGFEDGRLQVSPEQLHNLPAELHDGVVQAVASAIGDVFLVAVPVAALAFVAALMLQEIPLRERPGAMAAPGPGRPEPAGEVSIGG